MERYATRARGVLREELLDAAGRLVVERGYGGMRMQDVADAVGVSRQTVYNEFGDKWALAKAIVLRENDRYLDGVDETLARHDDLYTAVAAAVTYTLETAADDPFKKAVLTGEGGGDLLPLITTESEPLLFAAHARILRHARRRWPHLNPGELAEIIEAVVRLTVSHIVLPTDPPETVAHRLARLVTRCLGEPAPPDAPAR
jgi:AcrR family transcriptional regulator